MLVNVTARTPEQLLDRFGLPAFRLGQREAVGAALAGRDSLVVMPTGAGKSLCYQLPALADDREPTHPAHPRSTDPLVVVVSPLIALMDDQWRRLQRSGISAVMLASGMPEDHNAQALREIRCARAHVVLATPERFDSRAFTAALAARRVTLFAVDEAHCIAQWGHDFRPDYLRLGDAIESVGRPPVMALTATATPSVTKEIADRLRLHDWVEVRSGFDRPNLTFDVLQMDDEGAANRKLTALLHVLRNTTDRQDNLPAIVYCGTRRETEQLTAVLREQDIGTVAYHAGMSPADRRASQRAFMDAGAQVVVATSAFGMGIDKADVRNVVHWSVPTSLEGYYQEAGRAGRDGEPARALLLAARVDLGRLIHFNTERQATVSNLKNYLGRLAARAPGGVLERGRPTGTERMLLSIAERSGALALQRDASGYLRVELTGKLDTQAASRAVKLASERGWESYRTIERFISNTDTCRRCQILEHFGDRQAGVPTGRCCDVCEPDETLRAVIEDSSAYEGGKAGYEGNRAHGRGCGARRSRGPLVSAAAGANTQSGHRASATLGCVDAADADSHGVAHAVDGAQFQRLREWRRKRAKGKPPYMVTPNTVLEDVLRTRPGSIDELLEIRGIGPVFCRKHGESLLHTLREIDPTPVENARPGVEERPVEKTGMDELPSLMCLANQAIDDALGVGGGVR